jgi:putative alpha-1,2-mannosidase
MFNSESKTTGREQGCYGHWPIYGNEPSHHMAYLYNYIEKATEKVHYILDNFYKNAPDGLIGNEDWANECLVCVEFYGYLSSYS